MNVLYKGEKLKYIHNFHGEIVLDGTWKNGYYTVNDNSLQRLCDVI